MALKALHGQCALARRRIDFGMVHRAKLHPSDGVSCSVLCTQTQMQAYHRVAIHCPRGWVGGYQSQLG